MFNTLKNAFFLSIISGVLVTGLLLGLSFAPNYAIAETEVTYYTFVMHQAKGGEWQLPKPGKLTVGSYRFQIVRVPRDTQPGWIALRGEFEFVADPAGGVKLAKRHTLDKDIPQQTENVSFSLWWNTPSDKHNWKKARKKWVQPLINQMDKTIKGAADPNFMRFLLKKGVNEQWEEKQSNQNKNYSLYRLHYLDADTISIKYKKALSRFIDPNAEPTTDIQTLKQWVEAQDSFQNAGYLGNADEKHEEFYRHFQMLFNQLSPGGITTNQTKDFSENGSSEPEKSFLTIIIIFIIIIAIIAILLYNRHGKMHNIVTLFSNWFTNWFTKMYNRNSKMHNRRRYEDDEDYDIGEPESQALSKQKTPYLNVEPKKTQATLKSQSYDISKSQFDSLQQQVQILQHRLKTEEDLEKHVVRLFDKKLSGLFQSADFQKAVKAEIDPSLATLNTYFNEKLKELFDKKLESYAKKYWDKFAKEHNNPEIAARTSPSQASYLMIQKQHEPSSKDTKAYPTKAQRDMKPIANKATEVSQNVP